MTLHHATKAKRLRELERVAREAPSDRLHMDQFVDRTAPCGTAYCLAGFAGIDPWFQSQGWSFGLNHQAPNLPGYDSLSPFDSIAGPLAMFFGITYQEAGALFAVGHGGSLPGPHAVSKREVLYRIRRLQQGETISRYAAAR